MSHYFDFTLDKIQNSCDNYESINKLEGTNRDPARRL